ncbi:RDD family protein [Verrucomicrobium sp. 3C]|uniref:RDD family protein n=1 Tax=Verrucomicrobium sp. 3C TaxID=1134055 RepID=UPI000372A8D8|nr:RDD family protein [Verrucomicrobium sp. 3C]
MEYAGPRYDMFKYYWRRRFTADFIDAIAGYFFALLLFQLAGFSAGYYLATHRALIPIFRAIILPVSFLVGPWCYFALLERSSHGATQGKMWLQLRVYTPEGKPVNLIGATRRHACRIAAAMFALWPLFLSGTKIPSVVHWVLLAVNVPITLRYYYRNVDRISRSQVLPREYPPSSFQG